MLNPKELMLASTSVSGEYLTECPACGWECTHFDKVFALVRFREDAEPRYMSLDHRGVVEPLTKEQYPLSSRGTGRRHEFLLEGRCEACEKVWYESFRQHKGTTLRNTTDLD